jgi:hypothetical protein
MAESIVALAILSTALIALFGVLRQCAMAATQSRMLTKAVLLAESRLGEAKLDSNPSFGTTKGENDEFKWQTAIKQTDIDSLAAVEVIVSWIQQQQQKSYRLISMMKMKSFSEVKQ